MHPRIDHRSGVPKRSHNRSFRRIETPLNTMHCPGEVGLEPLIFSVLGSRFYGKVHGVSLRFNSVTVKPGSNKSFKIAEIPDSNERLQVAVWQSEDS